MGKDLKKFINKGAVAKRAKALVTESLLKENKVLKFPNGAFAFIGYAGQDKDFEGKEHFKFVTETTTPDGKKYKLWKNTLNGDLTAVPSIAGGLTESDGEDLKPEDTENVLLEDNDDEIKVYVNTWKNYNEYGADLVLYDNIDGWMSVDDAIAFCEEHADDEPFINDTENVPFDISEYDSASVVLDDLKQYQEMEDYDREMLGRILSTGDYDFDDALDILNDGDFNWYPGVYNDEDLGYAIIDTFGSPSDATPYADNYIDTEKLRRDLAFDVDEMYRETAEEEVDYEHRFDDPDSFDRDEEIDNWLEEHREELLDQLVDEVVDGDIDGDFIENYFDYEAFGRDVRFESTVYYLDDGALQLW